MNPLMALTARLEAASEAAKATEVSQALKTQDSRLARLSGPVALDSTGRRRPVVRQTIVQQRQLASQARNQAIQEFSQAVTAKAVGWLS